MEKADALRRRARVERGSTYDGSLARTCFGQKVMSLLRKAVRRRVVRE